MSTAVVEEYATYVEVFEDTTTTSVAVTEPLISIIEVGIQGPEGVAGTNGDKTFAYYFSNTASFTATHNLNKYPSVTVFDSAGDEVEGDIHYLSLNAVTVTFSSSFSGTATFN